MLFTLCHCLLLYSEVTTSTSDSVDLNLYTGQAVIFKVSRYLMCLKMAPYSLLHPLSSVRFESKIHFCASQDLSFARSKYFKFPETESRGDVWSIQPPDFSPKLYRSLSVPQKKERKANLNLSVPQPSETRRKTGLYLPNVLLESNKRKNPPKFITSYRPPDALESELMFVKTGKYPSEPYKNPKPYNFRPVSFWKHKIRFLHSLQNSHRHTD